MAEMFDTKAPLDRRAWLSTMAVASAGAIAGCNTGTGGGGTDDGGTGDDGTGDDGMGTDGTSDGGSGSGSLTELPPFRDAWMSVRTDGSAAVRLRFEGPVQPPLSDQGLGPADLVADGDVTVSPGSVDLSHVAPIRRGSSLEAIVEDFAERRSGWPGADRYVTERLRLDRSLPLGRSPRFYVRFPSGYQYAFPIAHRRAETSPIQLERSRADGLAAYGDVSRDARDRIVPGIEHFDRPELAAMRAYSEYRDRVLNEALYLYDWSGIERDATRHFRTEVGDVHSLLDTDLYGGLLVSTVPGADAATDPAAFERLETAHDELRRAFAQYQSTLEGLDSIPAGSDNEDWVTAIRRPDRGALALVVSRSEWVWKVRSPALATTRSRGRFGHHLEEYRSELSRQRSVVEEIRSNPAFSDATASGGEAWRLLKARADQLVGQVDDLLEAELSGLETLATEVS